MNRLIWLCRRGMKELDLLFLDYLQQEYPQATPGQQSAFRQLLQEQDPLILDYLFERREAEDAELAALLRHLRQRAARQKS